MTTREIITLLRESAKAGNEGYNALLEECAQKIEDFMRGPPEQTDTEE